MTISHWLFTRIRASHTSVMRSSKFIPTPGVSPFPAYTAPRLRDASSPALPITTSPLDSSWTVHEVMRHYPTAMLTFADLGVDECSDARLSLDAVARAVGMPAAALLAALAPFTVEEDDVDLERGIDHSTGNRVAAHPAAPAEPAR